MNDDHWEANRPDRMGWANDRLRRTFFRRLSYSKTKRLALLLASKRRDSYASVLNHIRTKGRFSVYLAKKYSDGYQRSQKEVDKIQDYTNKSTVL